MNKKNKYMFLVSQNFTKSLVDNFYKTDQNGLYYKFVNKDDNTVSLRMEVPGFSKDNLTVNLEDENLKVSGKYKFDGTTYEIDTQIKVPKGVDCSKATASVENGILLVTIPMKTEDKKSYNLLKK